MKQKKNDEKPLWAELFLTLWGLVYVAIGTYCWYLILTTDRAEPLGVLFLAAVGSFTLWSGCSTLLSMFKKN